MKMKRLGVIVLGVLLAFGAVGCSTGKPGFREETQRPDQQHDFATLYRQNCSACHGDNGSNGAAIPLNNPVYLAWAGRDHIQQVVSNGVPHGLMPAFGAGGGGLLTGQQVDDIVNGMVSHWTQAGILNGANAPAYNAVDPGDPQQGKAAFQIYCARCHGSDGTGIAPGGTASVRAAAAKKGLAVGSIVDPTYLSLISTQALRSIIVAGMPGENMPNWREDVQGKPLTDKEVTDIVAWLASNRVQFPGKPFAQQHSNMPQ
jgi:mono/diheme cytochrome c family protein